MGIFDLFKSKKDREREQSKKRRKAFREAEAAVNTVSERVAKLKRERDKSWQEARRYLKDGQKAAAQRSLQACRASEVLMAKVEKKRWVFDQFLTKLELAKTDQEFSTSLAAINTVIEIDPETVADVLDEVQDKLGEQADTDRIWDQVYAKEMEGAETLMPDQISSLEEMETQLNDEVAAEISDDSTSRVKEPTETATEESDQEVDDQISEGRDRLRKLMEDDK